MARWKAAVCGVDDHHQGYAQDTNRLSVSNNQALIEDARKWIGFNGKTKATQARLQGAGSVKRDAKIWEDWCKEHDYEVVFVKPMGKGLKKSAEEFKRITKWEGRTNEHSRDAAMIVFGR